MNESLIFAELIQNLSQDEKNRLDQLIYTRNLAELQILIIEYIKKYRAALVHLS